MIFGLDVDAKRKAVLANVGTAAVGIRRAKAVFKARLIGRRSIFVDIVGTM